MRRVAIAVLVLAAAALSGCAQSGMFVAGNLTTVELSEPNYKLVATDVSGTSKAGYLIGVSFSNGPKSGSLSLFRVSGTGQLYKEAMEGLWEEFESEHGAVAGRRLALVNIRYDADSRNFLVYSDISLSIRADVVEFVDD